MDEKWNLGSAASAVASYSGAEEGIQAAPAGRAMSAGGNR